MYWHMPVFPVLRKQRTEDHKFKANLDYIAKPWLKTRTFVVVYTTDTNEALNKTSLFRNLSVALMLLATQCEALDLSTVLTNVLYSVAYKS